MASRRRKCTRYSYRWTPTGRRRYCAKYGGLGFSGMGSVGGLGQATGLKANLSSVQGVLITGAVAAGGATITEMLFKEIKKYVTLEGYVGDAAEMAVGIAVGIVIGKYLKKPKIGAAFAIGPIVNVGLRIFGQIMGEGPAVAGLGRARGRSAIPRGRTAGLTRMLPVAQEQMPMAAGTGRLGAYQQAGRELPDFMQSHLDGIASVVH